MRWSVSLGAAHRWRLRHPLRTSWPPSCWVLSNDRLVRERQSPSLLVISCLQHHLLASYQEGQRVRCPDMFPFFLSNRTPTCYWAPRSPESRSCLPASLAARCNPRTKFWPVRVNSNVVCNGKWPSRSCALL
uniref:Uncharacterized protein n=1 Tax=Rousettus aegyptiacus TaxID=9407 RepID=A0A7J8GBQ8_ROUAE|nr:hypothetical protein HJG63_011791 [Rousettus aegyptiacus]